MAGTLVRRFVTFSGRGAAPGEAGEIEAVAVDDELGYVYYADETDGLDVAAAALGPYARGLLAMMNSGPRNFLIFDWRDVEAAIRVPGSGAQ